MDRLLIISVVIFLVFVFLTYLLHWLFNKKRFVKYIPSLLCIIFTVINVILARSGNGEGFKDLARIVVAIFAFTGFVSSIISALYLDYISPKVKK